MNELSRRLRLRLEIFDVKPDERGYMTDYNKESLLEMTASAGPNGSNAILQTLRTVLKQKPEQS
jgi:hypothetical protein